MMRKLTVVVDLTHEDWQRMVDATNTTAHAAEIIGNAVCGAVDASLVGVKDGPVTTARIDDEIIYSGKREAERDDSRTNLNEQSRYEEEEDARIEAARDEAAEPTDDGEPKYECSCYACNAEWKMRGAEYDDRCPRCASRAIEVTQI